MRKPEQAPEPSIEEILASIRRIIADDAPPAAGAAEEPTRLQVRSGTPRLRTADGKREDEVLELTEDFMLAEEAPAVRLREPEEPAEFASNGSYRDPFADNGDPFANNGNSFAQTDDPFAADADPFAKSNDPFADNADPFAEKEGADPYEDLGAQRGPQPIEAATTTATEPEAQRNAASNGLASVMDEVRRFVEVGKADPEEAPKPAARPLDNWTQPANEVFKSDPAPRPPSRWSARQKTPDASKGPEPLPGRPEPVARDQAPPRKAGLSSRDWSQGVQMPVPDGGPAMPFAAEEAVELPRSAPFPPAPEPRVAETASPAPAPQQPAAAPLPPAMKAVEAPSPTVSSDMQQRAEKLAERAVSDFADDKLESLPVAKFLKSDKPLMEVITGKLAGALARVGGARPELEEPAAPPIEDLVEENAAPYLPSPAPMDDPAGLDLSSEIPNFDGGFVPPSPLGTQPPSRPSAPMGSAAAIPDQDAFELPREDVDDMVAMSHPEQIESGAPYLPTGIAEQPEMPQMPAYPGRMMSRLSSTTVGAADFEALEASLDRPKTLEETVRDMLRPLLVQWLNENMPRIVNDAIREEMAAMGMKLPRRD